MKDRPTATAVERALQLQEGSVLAREVLALRRRVDELRPAAAHGARNPPEVIEEMRETIARLERELATYRETVTTGGPGVPFTEGWERGDSSRPPTAPPEEITVALPVSDEQAAFLCTDLDAVEYAPCPDCGHPHPAWISCEDEARIP